LLAQRASRRLGNISYGIYLLQLPLLVAVLRTPAATRLDLTSANGHWLLAMGVAVGLVCLATLCHAIVERPGVELGRRAYQLIARKGSAAASRRPALQER
jgi:peptidoglycan/LPS O-acetylase OafA/YrhL